MDNRTKQCPFCLQTIPLMATRCCYCTSHVPIPAPPKPKPASAPPKLIVSVSEGEWIDLGLRVKWASCNLGASKPEQYGDYYAWGETTTKLSYTESTSTTYGKTLAQLKYSGIIDASNNLAADYDVAQKLGKGRMPTKADKEELIEKCTWEWTSQSGVNGYRVTGPNGNSIFLPAAGKCGGFDSYVGLWGRYWSSTVGNDCFDADDLEFTSSEFNHNWRYHRFFGFSVRPVMDK